MKIFLSDNNAPVHPKVLEWMARVNESDEGSYGDDVWTKQAELAVKKLFATDPDVYFVGTGTAANVIGLAGLVKPWEGVICSTMAHINTDECGAFERSTGCKLTQIQTSDGKLTPGDIAPLLAAQGVEHTVDHRVVSVSNVTEDGYLYTAEELRALADFCHEHHLYLHLDGARIANAAQKLGLSVKEFTEDCGVDVLSFGGTKNGLMMCEAIVVFDRAKNDGYRFIRKQAMQLFPNSAI